MSSMVALSPAPPGATAHRHRSANWLRVTSSDVQQGTWACLWSMAGVALATIAGLGLTSVVPLPNVSMVYLLAVVFSAARFGIWPALLSSILSFLAYNFFFIEPSHTLSVAQPHELLALFVFLAIAVLTATIAGRARGEATRASHGARASGRLYEFARRLSGLADPESVLDSAAIQVNGDFGRRSIILLANGNQLSVAAAWPPEDQLEGDALSAAQLAYETDEATGTGTQMLSTVPWLFLPLRTSEGPVGVMGVSQDDATAPLEPQARTLFDTLAELTSTALERARLDQEIMAARAVAETERVRNTLLASISHDFRTPLASILGAATGLIDYGARLPESTRRDLLAQIKDEAEHLDGMVRNLLAMTRVEAHALEVNKDWVEVRELLDRAVAFAKRRGATQTFQVTVQNELPFLPADPILLDQVLANVIGNAVRYAGATARISLDGSFDGHQIVLSVTDDGPGIPPDVLPRIFDKFVRAPTSGDAGQGTGLGLAIAKGIVTAHQGSISAESPVADGRGTRIAVRLPIGEKSR